MSPSKKEIRLVAIEIEGPNLMGSPAIQTKYNFDLKIDELKNKPAFMVNTQSLVLFPSNDSIMFGCFESFFFEDRNSIPTAEELWILVCEAEASINKELQTKTNFSKMNLQPPNKKTLFPVLQSLVIIGFRLN